jgi:mono/diheme cytochrome c family protein
MRLFLKIVGTLLVLAVLTISAVLAYVAFALPDVGEPEDLQIEYTAERIERGRYLAYSITVCMDCHSTRDWTKFSGPITPGTLGMGGDRFDQNAGLPGVFYARNITPAGIGRYSDGELFRVITSGVTKEGRAMFPLMPYPNYGKMDPEDIYSIIAYLRSLPAIENEVPESKADFPMNFILNTIPQPPSFTKKPDPSDQIAYGKYLANAASCIECHTQVDKGQIIAGLEFAGGREFLWPDGSVVRSANITPHTGSGIGSWTLENFLSRFRQYSDSTYLERSVQPGEFNTLMPWTMYAEMTDEDLTAIYAYLRTVPAIDNKVVVWTPGEEGMASRR